MNTKPLTEKQVLDIVRAGATVTATQFQAGLDRGLRGMLEEGLVLEATVAAKLPKTTLRACGIK